MAITITVEGELLIEIAGPLESQFDQLVVTGSATLGGTLKVVLDGYIPAEGETFSIMSYTDYLLGFEELIVAGGPEWLDFAIDYQPTQVVITASRLRCRCWPSLVCSLAASALTSAIRCHGRITTPGFVRAALDFPDNNAEPNPPIASGPAAGESVHQRPGHRHVQLIPANANAPSYARCLIW
jgi:hypothetical protein